MIFLNALDHLKIFMSIKIKVKLLLALDEYLLPGIKIKKMLDVFIY
jgi:hypothetical protein